MAMWWPRFCARSCCAPQTIALARVRARIQLTLESGLGLAKTRADLALLRRLAELRREGFPPAAGPIAQTVHRTVLNETRPDARAVGHGGPSAPGDHAGHHGLRVHGRGPIVQTARMIVRSVRPPFCAALSGQQ